MERFSTINNIIKNYYKSIEITPNYDQKDGKIIFMFSIGSLSDELREKISKEGNEEFLQIADKKIKESRELGYTKGLYKTTIDWVKDESESGFESWQKKNAPTLTNLAHGFLLEDECVSYPKCGHCGQYLILKKDAQQQFINMEQAGLMAYAREYVLKGTEDTEKKSRFNIFWAFSLSQPFRDVLDDTRVEKDLKRWFVYKNFEDVIAKNLLSLEGFRKNI